MDRYEQKLYLETKYISDTNLVQLPVGSFVVALDGLGDAPLMLP
jgi:hypothetical protein